MKPGEDGKTARYTDLYLVNLNEILQWQRTTNIGAYAIGIVEEIVLQRLGMLPSRYLLEKVAPCSTLAEAVKIAEEWIEDCREIERQQARHPKANRKLLSESTATPGENAPDPQIVQKKKKVRGDSDAG